MQWKYASSSVTGTSHIHTETPCQDAHVCEFISGSKFDCLVLAVADGAGSATHSDIGSRLSCDLLVEFVREWCNGFYEVSPLSRYFVEEWHRSLCEKLEAESKLHEVSLSLMVKRYFSKLVMGRLY
jgi:serine/threonine protein phosphatase PrpC